MRSIGASAGVSFDRRDDRLGIFQVDVARDIETEKAALFLSMDHRDDARSMRLLDGTDGLRPARSKPTAGQERLQHQQREEKEKDGGEIE
jgi:hypothetical protein